MKKTFLTSALFTLTICAMALSIIFAVEGSKMTYAAEEHMTYGLYTDADLAELRGGKTFTRQYLDNAILRCKDGDGDGKSYVDPDRKVSNATTSSATTKAYYFSLYSDEDYDYNAGNIGKTPAGTTFYQTFGDSEVFYQAYPGGVTRGEEWVLDDEIDTTYYSSISFNIGYKSTSPSGDTEGESYVYIYGEDLNDNPIIVNKKISFGVNYWSTGVIEFPSEMKNVRRIAVSILWDTVDNQGSGSYIYLSGFKVNAQVEKNDDISLRANDMALDFYNGNQMCGLINDKSMRIYHSAGGYARNYGITDGYCYGTQRLSVGTFFTMRMKEPIKVSEHKYLDVELMVVPQNAEGKYQKETASRFYLTALKFDATDETSGKTYELMGKQWVTCRINLVDVADEYGFVNQIIFRYSGNDSGRAESEESNYSVLIGIHDAMITNYEDTEVLFYYIESPTVTDENVSFRLKSSVAFSYDESVLPEFKQGICINGQILLDLEIGDGATLFLNGYYVEITVKKSLFKFDDTDCVEIAKGISLKDGLITKDKEKFVYYKSLDRFELLPSDNIDKKTAVSIDIVEMGTVDETTSMYGQDVTENTIFITFCYRTCFNQQAGHIQLPMDTMASYAGCSDDYVYELAKQGIIQSCMDLLYVNGKSIREWMKLDHEAGLDNLIRVSFMGELNNGKWMRIMAAKDSNLKLGVNRDMSLMFKKGFMTASGKYIDKDLYYEIAAKDAKSVNSLFHMVDTNNYEIIYAEGDYNGCSSSIADASLVSVIAILAVIGLFNFILLIKKRKVN